MKKIVRTFVMFMVGVLALVPTIKVKAQSPAKVYLFYGEGCRYCAGAMEYFESLEPEYGEMFEVVKYEVWSNENNQAILEKVAAVFGDEVGGVPYIVIGDKTFAGYDLDGGYDEDILNAIKNLYNAEERFDVMENLDIEVKKSSSDVVLYVVLGALVVLAVVLLVVGRNSTYVEDVPAKEVKAEAKKVVKEEPKKVETKAVKKETAKPVAKKAPAKATKPAAKKTATKTTANKATTKAPAKKTTTKTTAKKTTTKKTTKK